MDDKAERAELGKKVRKELFMNLLTIITASSITC